MSDDPNATWPLPGYNPGKRLHLHALGVIAITYAAFERSLNDFYELHPSRQKEKGNVCSLNRNELLHAEQYPPSFGGR
jgi:hypothetical protein